MDRQRGGGGRDEERRLKENAGAMARETNDKTLPRTASVMGETKRRKPTRNGKVVQPTVPRGGRTITLTSFCTYYRLNLYLLQLLFLLLLYFLLLNNTGKTYHCCCLLALFLLFVLLVLMLLTPTIWHFCTANIAVSYCGVFLSQPSLFPTVAAAD